MKVVIENWRHMVNKFEFETKIKKQSLKILWKVQMKMLNCTKNCKNNQISVKIINNLKSLLFLFFKAHV